MTITLKKCQCVSLCRRVTLWSSGDRKRPYDRCELLLCAISDRRIINSTRLLPLAAILRRNELSFLIASYRVHVCSDICRCSARVRSVSEKLIYGICCKARCIFVTVGSYWIQDLLSASVHVTVGAAVLVQLVQLYWYSWCSCTGTVGAAVLVQLVLQSRQVPYESWFEST